MGPYLLADIVQKTRDFMRDNTQFNALLRGQETSDTLIELCIELTTDDFTVTTPVTNTFDLDNFPSLKLLIYGTVINILTSAGILQSRNNLNYSDGGITVASSDHTQLYQSWIDRLTQEYESKKKSLKMQLNAEQCYATLPSEYAYIELGTRRVQYGL